MNAILNVGTDSTIRLPFQAWRAVENTLIRPLGNLVKARKFFVVPASNVPHLNNEAML